MFCGVTQADPLGDVEKFIDSQMRPVKASINGAADKVPDKVPDEEPAKLVKQYLVKWKSRSYLHCSWYGLSSPNCELVSNNSCWSWAYLKFSC